MPIGHWTITEDSEAEQSRYYTAARSHMSMRMLESGNLLTVQAFLLMGNYLQKRDRPNTGYNFIGIAYRMALGLGLHREPPGGMTPSEPFSNERRRVIWWIAYCFDSGFSFTTGRPIMVSDSFIETKLPRNIDDSACTLDGGIPDSTGNPTTYSALIAQSRMASIGNVVFSEIISPSTQTLVDLRTSRSIDNQLKAWKLSLPSYFTAHGVPEWFRGPRAIVLWKEENIRLLLWWSSKRMCTSPSDHEEAQNMCNFTAVETIQDISNFCRENSEILHTGVSWYATYYLFQAAVVLSIHHLRPTESINRNLDNIGAELWSSSINRSRECLNALSRTNTAAMRCLEVLERISEQPQSGPHLPCLVSTSQVNCPSDIVQQEAIARDVDVPAPMLAVDPTLQMLFEDTSWDKDLFHDLNGFPSTGEGEAFDYLPPSTEPGWLKFSDPAGHGSNSTA
ncbi:uncharacterized protein N7511_008808 [Penicillium nucicola]|uniref:uncharacterized protein n=1 Tax=Penicillium nucicola TaxID=1850975 RepID=UPI0025452211|nr:uncharacterized protein N7511_008808 [Penicillium nucicola]KAJ5747112.1 hypothetical protein N7511_008808 [Penicillium nucicola]